MFVYELSGCWFESSCSHLNFKFCACFEQGVPWHSGNYRMWIHSETRTWHDKNIQSVIIQFEKIHKSTFQQMQVFLLYFYDAYDVNLWEKKFGKSTTYSCRTNVLIELLWKKNRRSWRLNKSSKTFLNQWNQLVFVDCIVCRLI